MENESLHPLITGLCDVFHIDMSTDDAAEKSINSEMIRVCDRLHKMYEFIDTEQIMQKLCCDIHKTIDTILPLTSQTERLIYRKEYTYIRPFDNRIYAFAACFIY
jgi:hypothetical protein